ncbi:MAG: DUF5723 family protein [Chitinispirillales bacterium]|jgi:outer membrane protein OmpA-like peptidoglycan-associated protein|nr:DUF5723 family protein [Chitinispirillales bacterium]
MDMNTSMGRYIIVALPILLLAGFAFGRGTDNNPVSTGSTQPMSRGASVYDGGFGNPALVGLNRFPRSSLSLLPTSVALWSDKLAPPFNRYLLTSPLDFERYFAAYLTNIFEKSFGLDAGNQYLSPERVSEILTEELRGGVGIYIGAQTSPFMFATRGFALNVRSYTDVDLRIPEGMLLPFFSETAGLTAGNTLDLSNFRVDAVWASEIAVKLGFSTVLPVMRDHLGLNRGAAGAGVKLVLGHGYLKADTDNNSTLAYDSVENKYVADARVDIISIGTGLHGDYSFSDSLLWKRPIAGQGWGLDFGAVFHNDNHFVSVDVQDIGMIFWDGKQVYRATHEYEKDFDIFDITNDFREMFNIDSLEPTNQYMVTWLPTSFNLGYNYFYEIPKDWAGHTLLGYVSAGGSYRQQIVLGPGRNTFVPRLALGATAGLLDGYLPVRYGLILGGPESLASSVGIGFDLKYVSFDASYKAVGGPFLIASRGFEAALGLTFRWGWKPPRRYIVVQEPEAPVVIGAVTPEQDDPPLPELPDFPEEEYVEIVHEYPRVEIVLTMVAPTVEEAEQLSTSQRAINFRTGGSDLTQGSHAALNEIAEFLKKYPHIRYEIQGHTDSQGGERFNLLLSMDRAAAVKRYLVSKGVPEESLIAVGYGKSKPIADNGTPVGRAQNRRVEFVQILSQEQYDALKQIELELVRSLTGQVLQGAR